MTEHALTRQSIDAPIFEINFKNIERPAVKQHCEARGHLVGPALARRRIVL